MTEREGTNEPGGADEIAAAHDALRAGREHPSDPIERDAVRDTRSNSMTNTASRDDRQDAIDDPE